MTVAMQNLPCEASAPSHARRWTAEQLSHVLPPSAPASIELIEDAVLCVSELVSNAVRAGCTSLAVRLATDASSVRVSIIDDAPGEPVPRQAGPFDIAGRGLQIVAALAGRWGFELAGDGKEVWAEFTRAA